METALIRAPECRSTKRVLALGRANAKDGKVVFLHAKAAWIGAMVMTALIAGPLTFSWSAFSVFLALTAVTICCGHSVGMHRLLIHRSFKAPPIVEKLFVYLGVLVGMAGPLGMIRLHDFRDWGQRQTACHDFFAHRAGFWKDAWWQLCCGIDLANAPDFQIEDEVRADPFYRVLERTWMAQQIVVAVPLYLFGGLSFVVWGVCCRVSVSLIGHWLVGYHAHQPGEQFFHVKDACVQGYNLPKLGLVTFGEAFHENHHAFPNSARLGLFEGQADPGWWLIKALERLGLAWDVKTPDILEPRPGLRVNRAAAAQGQDRPAWLRTLVQ